MKNLIKKIQQVEIGAAGLFLVIFLITIVFQIISRHVGVSAVWTEEIIEYSFIWSVFLGAAGMVYEKKHFSFSSLADHLKSEKSKRILSIVISAIMLVFALLLIFYGIRAAIRFWNYKWLNIPVLKRGWTWLCLPICGATSAIFLIDSIVTDSQAILGGCKENKSENSNENKNGGAD